MKFGVEFLELFVVKLASIVRNYDSRQAKSAYNGLPYKVPCSLFDDLSHYFSFHPLSEVVNSDEEEFPLQGGHKKGSQDIYTPLSEGPRGTQWNEFSNWLTLNTSMSLA